MNDRLPLNESEIVARRALVCVARAMLSGQLSCLEGAVLVLGLRQGIGGLSDNDADFNAFAAISSETDDLPLAAQRQYWTPEALARLNRNLIGLKSGQGLLHSSHAKT